jgi:hypothetical protein
MDGAPEDFGVVENHSIVCQHLHELGKSEVV